MSPKSPTTMIKNLNSYFLGIFVFVKYPILLIPTFITMVIAYLSPLKGFAIALILAVIIDFISGIWAAKKRGEKVNSHVMRNSVTKLLCYSLTIIFCWVIQKEVFIFEWAKIVNLATALIVLSELKSILENFGHITGNKVFNNIFKTIYNMFRKNTPEVSDDSEEQKPTV
jgi:phage-related holin